MNDTATAEADFYILAWGLVAMSVCTSLSRKEATARLNREMPTGTSSHWAISKDKTFATGEANPHRCETFKTNKHYLFNC